MRKAFVSSATVLQREQSRALWVSRRVVPAVVPDVDRDGLRHLAGREQVSRPVLQEVLQEVLQVSLPQAALPVRLSAQHPVERGTAREQPSVRCQAQADVRRRDAASRRECRAQPEVRSVGAVLRAQRKARRLAVSRSMEPVPRRALAKTAVPFVQQAEALVPAVAVVLLSELPLAEVLPSAARAAVEALPLEVREVAVERPSEARAAEAVQPSAVPAAAEVPLLEARAVEEVRPVAQQAVAAVRPSEVPVAAREQPSVARAARLSAAPSVHSDRLVPLAR
ncbi:MAG: hypothetical protein V4661_10965 [Pseudomonadota bacterium]